MRTYFDCSCDTKRPGKHYIGADGIEFHAWLEDGRMWKNEVVSVPQTLVDQIAADKTAREAAIRTKTQTRATLLGRLEDGTATDSDRDEILKLLLR